MSALQSVEALAAPWEWVDLGETGIGVAERPALGTTARVAVWPPDSLAIALAAVDRELEALDGQASRFRSDSEITRLHRSHGETFLISEGLAETIFIALRAARWTRGLVDPTVGRALVSLGYDRDFAAIDPDGSLSDQPPLPAPGWQSVQLDGRILHLPRKVMLDLGATAKGIGSDRSAAAAFTRAGRSGGVLISLGGDIAIAGQSPDGGWPVLVTDDPLPSPGSQTQVVRLSGGAMATSSVGWRCWQRGGQDLHHIIDPRTGLPSTGRWHTASVAAPTCVAANAASTALIVGGEEAESWLAETGLPARLVDHDGSVRLFGSWPKEEGAVLHFPPADWLGGEVRLPEDTP